MDWIIFNGKRFTRFGKYWRSARKFLHRAVWEFHYQRPIPKGYHVHHKDGNRENNDISNLQLKEGRQHLSEHQKGHKRRPVAALAALAVWRKTDEGRRYMSAMGKRNQHFMRAQSEFACEQCGRHFVAQDTGINRFCSNACKARYRRRSGADRIDATCAVCGTHFMANKFKPAKCCSLSCGRKMWLATPKGKAHLARLASAKRRKK